LHRNERKYAGLLPAVAGAIARFVPKPATCDWTLGKPWLLTVIAIGLVAESLISRSV
jgi:hypothetical protein